MVLNKRDNMKIAVCIPSYNEKDNIERITRIIDEGLIKIGEVSSVIINCDNCSPDGTNILFNNVKTKHQKVSIVDSRKGKGINLLNFFNYCEQNDVDYAFTFDSDLKSIDSTWIEKYYNSLKDGNDFIIPKYRRNYQEGNTTNHFIGPALYERYGIFIRQPIGGDYGFNKKFIRNILKKEFTPNILIYGIDIFMVVTAICNNLKIAEVELGYKIHKPSLSKMECIFESVLRGFSEVCRQYPECNEKKPIHYECYKYELKELQNYSSVEAKYLKFCEINKLNNYNEILNYWNNLLQEYIFNVENPSEKLIAKMKEIFVCRAVSFWLKNQDNPDWEKQLIKELYSEEII